MAEQLFNGSLQFKKQAEKFKIQGRNKRTSQGGNDKRNLEYDGHSAYFEREGN